MQKFFLALLVFIPATACGILLGFSSPAIFFLSALAIVPLAKFIGEATEQLAGRSGAALGGFLNATFGNATELIVGIFAIRAGLIDVVKASITGSIIGNLLLVLGTAIVAGGVRYKSQQFNRTAALAAASTLLLAVIAITMPAIFSESVPAIGGSAAVESLSLFVAAMMLLAYCASLWFSLYTHAHLYAEEVEKYEKKWSSAKSIAVLFASTLAVVWASDVLVGTILPVAEQLGWTQIFIGVVVIAIVGNAAEHASAVLMALKNKMELAIQISIGSATQIAMFVAPILVISSIFFPHSMNLVFNTFELVAIVLSVLIVNIVVGDGESNWFEGVQLLAAYAIMAIAFFLHP